MVPKLRRRGTEDQRLRRFKKYARRRTWHMIPTLAPQLAQLAHRLAGPVPR